MPEGQQDPEVQKYLSNSQYGHEDILKAVYDIVRNAVPDARESMQWGMPVFSKERNFCYIKDEKEYVTLGFFSRESLRKLDIKLDGIGKSVCHITIKSHKDLKKSLIARAVETLAKANSILLLSGISKYILKCNNLIH